MKFCDFFAFYILNVMFFFIHNTFNQKNVVVIEKIIRVFVKMTQTRKNIVQIHSPISPFKRHNLFFAFPTSTSIVCKSESGG